jgi:hypothetical protein
MYEYCLTDSVFTIFHKDLIFWQSIVINLCLIHSMRNFYLFSLLTLSCTMLAFFAHAQASLNVDEELNQCEKYLQKRSFAKAQKCYLDALPFKPNNIKLLVRLAEVSYQLNNEEAVRNYVSRAAQVNAQEAYDPLMFLAQKMSFRKDNVLAVFILDKLANTTSDLAQKSKIGSLKSSYLLQKYELQTPRYNVVLDNLGDSINSVESEYLPALSLDGETMVFTRRVGGANEDFFISTKDSSGRWRAAQNLGYPPNTSFPDGAAKLSADGNYLFFTRCDMRSKNGIEGGGCDLAFCFKEFDNEGSYTWSSPQYFGFTINTSAYEGQPCLSSDNQDLYFVSEREGGFGGKDIYVSHFNKDGLWSKPINLGANINTSGDETSPFIHPDNETLYFASNGHPTIGSMDLFISRKINDTTWQKVSNLGSPINSANFDGSIVVNAKGTKAYLASEREGTRGKLDIYSCDLYKGIQPIPTLVVKGIVSDKYTKVKLKKERINFYSWPQEQLINSDLSNAGDASFTHALHIGKQYLMEVQVPTYRPYYKILDLRKDTFPDNFYNNIRLREPNIIDTLYKNNWRVDTLQKQLDSAALVEIQKVTAQWQAWAADSADIKILLQAYHYYGDSDSDTLAQVYINECLARINAIRLAFKAADIPLSNIILSIDPYIWRDERDDYEQVEINIVESY